MHFLEIFNTAGGVFGILMTITAAVFGSLYGRQKAVKQKDSGTITSYEKNSTALEQLLSTREKELGEARLRHAENQKRIELLEQKANILENHVNQAPSISKLISDLSKESTIRSKQHKELMQAITSMTMELGNIAKNIVTERGDSAVAEGK